VTVAVLDIRIKPCQSARDADAGRLQSFHKDSRRQPHVQ